MICNLTRRTYLAEHPRWALTPWERLRGMIGRRFAAGEFDALVFERCSSIHSCWMSIPIDAVFFDGENRITAIRSDLAPWQLAFGGRGARGVIELPAGAAALAECKIGDLLNLNSTLTGEAIEKLTKGAILKSGISTLSADSIAREES